MFATEQFFWQVEGCHPSSMAVFLERSREGQMKIMIYRAGKSLSKEGNIGIKQNK